MPRTPATQKLPYERQLRAGARAALYSSLAFTAAVGAVLLPMARGTIDARVDESWHGVDYQSMPEVQLFQELVRQDSSPSGDEGALALTIARRLADAGIAAHVERLPERKANLWAVIEGEDPRAIVLHSHLDVEPVTEIESWKYPPFAAQIEAPWLYGRGAFDMKSVMAAQVWSFVELKRRFDRTGERPRHSVILLATSSEETGSELGAQWVLHQQPDLVRRFWVVLTEGGVLEATERGHIKYWGHAFAQKVFVNVLACSSNRQRLEDLATDLRQHTERMVVKRTSEVDTFFASYAGTRQDPLFQAAFRDPDGLRYQAWIYDRLSPLARSLLRDEVAVFPIREQEDGSFSVRLVLHLLPGTDLEAATAELLPPWLMWGVAYAVVPPRNLLSDNTNQGAGYHHPVLGAIEGTIAERYGAPAQGPYFLSFYANDSRYFSGAGIPSFGFTPFLFLATDSFSIGGANERVAIPDFVEGVVLYQQVLERALGLHPSRTGERADSIWRSASAR